jgi:hypothetical protein
MDKNEEEDTQSQARRAVGVCVALPEEKYRGQVTRGWDCSHEGEKGGGDPTYRSPQKMPWISDACLAKFLSLTGPIPL